MVDEKKLEEHLDYAKRDVKTDSYPMSIGELVSMYESKEIILRPEYQRYFRWSDDQKSKLIESILIGLPLPSFFMAQDEGGRWEVVDGMQRLSTIFDFLGILDKRNTDQEGYTRFESLTSNLFYLKEFSGKRWVDFSRRVQLDFKRTKIQLTILMRSTNLDVKFELFQRLNSGGTEISGQELRNAILAGQSPKMLRWFEDLAGDSAFRSVVGLAEPELKARYDMELVLRFVALLSDQSEKIKDFNSVDVFLTHVLRYFMEDESFDFERNGDLFKRTFKKMHEVFGPNSLKYKTSPGSGKFSIAFFEAVALGIAQNIDNLPSNDQMIDKWNNIALNSIYRDASGSGKNAKSRIPKLMNLGKEVFSAA